MLKNLYGCKHMVYRIFLHVGNVNKYLDIEADSMYEAVCLYHRIYNNRHYWHIKQLKS